MSDRNRLYNGRFLHSLNNWTASSAAYEAGGGDDHFGMARLQAAGYITQQFSVVSPRLYTVHISARPTGGDLLQGDVKIEITDAYGDAVTTLALAAAVAGTWTETTTQVGLVPGGTYTAKIVNDSALIVDVDDVWIWFIPITRAEIADRLADQYSNLVAEASFSTTPNGSKTEGDFTYPIDQAMRDTDALDPYTGKPDVRYIDADEVSQAIDAAGQHLLLKLKFYFDTLVDIKIGSRSEALSQISKNLQTNIESGQSSAAGTVQMRPLQHKARDYDFS